MLFQNIYKDPNTKIVYENQIRDARNDASLANNYIIKYYEFLHDRWFFHKRAIKNFLPNFLVAEFRTPFNRFFLEVIVYFFTFLLPLLVLVYITVKFVAYQNTEIAFLHFMCVAGDGFIAIHFLHDFYYNINKYRDHKQENYGLLNIIRETNAIHPEYWPEPEIGRKNFGVHTLIERGSLKLYGIARKTIVFYWFCSVYKKISQEEDFSKIKNGISLLNITSESLRYLLACLSLSWLTFYLLCFIHHNTSFHHFISNDVYGNPFRWVWAFLLLYALLTRLIEPVNHHFSSTEASHSPEQKVFLARFKRILFKVQRYPLKQSIIIGGICFAFFIFKAQKKLSGNEQYYQANKVFLTTLNDGCRKYWKMSLQLSREKFLTEFYETDVALGHLYFRRVLVNRKMRLANFSGAELHNFYFKNIIFSDALFNHTSLHNSKFDACSLPGVTLRQSEIVRSMFAVKDTVLDIEGSEIINSVFCGENEKDIRLNISNSSIMGVCTRKSRVCLDTVSRNHWIVSLLTDQPVSGDTFAPKNSKPVQIDHLFWNYYDLENHRHSENAAFCSWEKLSLDSLCSNMPSHFDLGTNVFFSPKGVLVKMASISMWTK